MIKNHLHKENLHHAYLVEGNTDAMRREIFNFFEETGIKTTGNPDFTHIAIDTFKIDDARNLKSMGDERGFSGSESSKKIFVISTNNILLEAQNSMLKIFEEPIENTHFFVIVPDTNSLLHTFVSRFYVIKDPKELFRQDLKSEAENFLNTTLQKRLDFIKDFIVEAKEESTSPQPSPYKGEGEIDSARSKALKFLNSLENILHANMSKGTFDINTKVFEHIFKVRQNLRQPGSAVKTLLESVAISVPILKI